MSKLSFLFLVGVSIIAYQLLPQMIHSSSKQPVQFGMPDLRFSKIEIEEGNGVAVGTDIHIRGEIVNTGRPFKGLKLIIKGKSLSKRLLTLSEGSSLRVTQGDLFTAPQTERLQVLVRKGVATATLPDVRCVEPVLEFCINMTALKTGKGDLEVTAQPLTKNAKPVKENLIAFVDSSTVNEKVATQTSDRKMDGLNGLFAQMIADDYKRQNPNYIPPEQRAMGYKNTEELQRELEYNSSSHGGFRFVTNRNDYDGTTNNDPCDWNRKAAGNVQD